MEKTLRREQVLTMESGSQLDQKIGELLMKIEPKYDEILGLDGWIIGKDVWSSQIPRYSLDMSAAWEMEESLIALNSPYLTMRYVENLYEIVNQTTSSTTSSYLNIAHASPLQRCKAALLAVLEL